jgi:hypothetical protein
MDVEMMGDVSHSSMASLGADLMLREVKYFFAAANLYITVSTVSIEIDGVNHTWSADVAETRIDAA